MKLNNQSLHFVLIDRLIETGSVPSMSALEQIFASDHNTVIKALLDLEEYHGCALDQDHKILAVHPFSTVPTNFEVISGESRWWPNCMWCGLGVISLTGGSGVLCTRIFQEEHITTLKVVDGTVEHSDFIVHFPIPMASVWDNVVYSCSVMQLFRREEDLDKWCEKNEVTKGDVVPIETVNQLAKKWYIKHRRPDWHKWTIEEAQSIFNSLGLTHPIWSLESSSGRF